MIKHILLFLITLCAFTPQLAAQDTIAMRNGDVILGKVHEVGVSEIKYYKPDNLSGPLYAVAKVDVFMVKYENGQKDVFSNTESRVPAVQTPAPRPETQRRGTINDDYVRLNKMASRRTTAGIIITGLGVGLMGTGIALAATEMRAAQRGQRVTGIQTVAGTFCILAGIAGTIIGPINLAKGARYRRRAQEVGPLVGFEPISNHTLDRYTSRLTQNRLGTVSLTF